MYYCLDKIYDEIFSDIEVDYKFYYECFMVFNVCLVLNVMKCMKVLGDINIIVIGYGFFLCYNLVELINCY